MIIDLLVAGLCLYMSYTNIRMLARLPLNAWGFEQFLLAAVTLLLMVVGLYKTYKLVSAFVTAQKRAAKQAEELRQFGATQDEADNEYDDDEYEDDNE